MMVIDYYYEKWLEEQRMMAVIEECLLTEEEVVNVYKDYPHLDPSYKDDYKTEVAMRDEALLLKAIPIIQQAERKRIFRGIEDKWGWATGKWKDNDAIMTIRYGDLQALKGKEEQDEQREG